MLSLPNKVLLGAVAQLVAHLHGMQGVRGSSPLSSTCKDCGVAWHYMAARKPYGRVPHFDLRGQRQHEIAPLQLVGRISSLTFWVRQMSLSGQALSLNS